MSYTVIVVCSVILLMALTVWQTAAQRKFLAAYRQRRGVALDLADPDLVAQPLSWLRTAPARTWAIFRADTTPLADPELEALRNRYMVRRRIWAFVGLVVLVVLFLAPRVLPP